MHVDPELLALLALGETAGTEDERAHVASCSACGDELDALQRVVRLGRTVSPGPLAAPGGQVWDRIRAELSLTPTLEPTPGASGPAASVLSASLSPVELFPPDASGTAEVATDERGRRVLQLTVRGELPGAGLRQAWLVHRHLPSRRQTLGILDGVHGVWTVDHSIDLEAYPILEISQQELGETEHSGHALLRGELAPAR